MHAALCIPAVTGAWAHEGGGAFHNNGAIFHWNKSLIEGLDVADYSVRTLDMSRIGPVLTGDPYDIKGGPPVTAMIIQNMNPVQVAPEQRKVKAGFAREDLFVAVHEHFMTATAQMADVVLPATMFLEHDDVYQAGGQQSILLGPKLVEAPGECWSNHDVICALAKRVGAEHRGFAHEPARDHRLDAAELGLGHARRARGEEVDRLPARVRHGALRRRLRLSGQEIPLQAGVAARAGRAQLRLGARPRHAGAARPLGRDREGGCQASVPSRHQSRRATTSTRRSTRRRPAAAEAGPPRVKMHPEDLAALGIADGARVRMGNERGEITLAAEAFEGVLRGVVIVESIAPNDQFEGGWGINTLTSAVQAAPYGGAPFHDNHVWIRGA